MLLARRSLGSTRTRNFLRAKKWKVSISWMTLTWSVKYKCVWANSFPKEKMISFRQCGPFRYRRITSICWHPSLTWWPPSQQDHASFSMSILPAIHFWKIWRNTSFASTRITPSSWNRSTVAPSSTPFLMGSSQEKNQTAQTQVAKETEKMERLENWLSSFVTQSDATGRIWPSRAFSNASHTSG